MAAYNRHKAEPLLPHLPASAKGKVRDFRPLTTPEGNSWRAYREDLIGATPIRKYPHEAKRERGITKLLPKNKYSSIQATDFLSRYYGDAMVPQILEAQKANKKNRALEGDRVQLATDIIPAVRLPFKDAGLLGYNLMRGRPDDPARKLTGVGIDPNYTYTYGDYDPATGKRKYETKEGEKLQSLAGNKPLIAMRGMGVPFDSQMQESDTAEHEGGHWLNYFTDEQSKRMKGNLPEKGTISYYHDIATPQEVAQNLGQLQRQFFRGTEKMLGEGKGRRMTTDDFNKMLEKDSNAVKMLGLPSAEDKGNAVHFLNRLRQWQKHDPEKAGALIKQLQEVKDSFVDTGGSPQRGLSPQQGQSNYFPEQMA